LRKPYAWVEGTTAIGSKSIFAGMDKNNDKNEEFKKDQDKHQF